MEIRKNCTGPLFLCGVSFGACLGTRVIAEFGEELKINKFVSISNPFSIDKIAYMTKEKIDA